MSVDAAIALAAAAVTVVSAAIATLARAPRTAGASLAVTVIAVATLLAATGAGDVAVVVAPPALAGAALLAATATRLGLRSPAPSRALVPGAGLVLLPLVALLAVAVGQDRSVGAGSPTTATAVVDVLFGRFGAATGAGIAVVAAALVAIAARRHAGPAE